MTNSKENTSSLTKTKTRSISRVFTIVLSLTVVLVTAVTVSSIYLIISQKAKTQLEEKANEYITSLATVLEIPVWNLNHEAIKRIGKAYAFNELIEKIKIVDDKGVVFFEFERLSEAPEVSRAHKIVHEGEIIGMIQISLTAKSYGEANRRLLLVGSATLFAVVFVLVLVTGYFSRLLLNRLLDRLGAIVNNYASGIYDTSEQDMPFLEFQPLVRVLGEMGDRINSQMTELRDAEKKYRSIFENAVEGIFQTTPEGRILSANPAMAQILRYDSVEELLETVSDIGQQMYVDQARRMELVQIMKEGKNVPGFQIQLYRKDRIKVWASLHARPVLDNNGELIMIEGILEDITERKIVERALEESEAKIRSILDNIGIGVVLMNPEMEVLEINRQIREWFPDIDLSKKPVCYQIFNDPPRETVCEYCSTIKSLQDGLVHESNAQTPTGGFNRNYRFLSTPIISASGEITAVIEMIEDITEKFSLESQLQHAQKMESIGRLAGGVAHDFNNMLGVIIGNSESAMDEVESTHPIFSSLKEIWKAAQRSADLTEQLLAFARKQTVAPKVLDLNDTVEGMLKMLRRLIGEDIDLAWLPGARVWPVKMDPSQIDQILANLCINARDAISGVGKVTIETHAVTFDKDYCADHPEFIEGEYSVLTVSDNGHGIDKEILDKIFEPFFTTKGTGKGTGLGLATVYGIIKQNNGFIRVYSESENGTIFKIYLPRHMTGAVQMLQQEKVITSALGHETILLVEDEPSILDMSRLVLEKLGYKVFTASTPGEAIRIAKEYPDEIHLLITDVVMPEMDGVSLAKNLASHYSGIRHLFMSGYSGDVIALHGVLDEGVNFIQKPFSIQKFAEKVREVLDSE